MQVAVQIVSSLGNQGQIQPALITWLIILFQAICFAIVGCAPGKAPFLHSLLVLFGLWLVQALLLFLPTYSSDLWLEYAGTMFFSSLLGGMLSLLLVRLQIPQVLSTWMHRRSASFNMFIIFLVSASVLIISFMFLGSAPVLQGILVFLFWPFAGFSLISLIDGSHWGMGKSTSYYCPYCKTKIRLEKIPTVRAIFSCPQCGKAIRLD